MALWTIGDLHLSSTTNKPMDVFGERWSNHALKIEHDWISKVSPEDTVVIAGDISWAINLEELQDDIAFLNRLPGRKILLKGNHDYWWQTLNKLNVFLCENKFENIFFLQNNHFLYENIAICGTRGWALDGDNHLKMIARETARLELSLQSAPIDAEKIVFLHFPPILSGEICEPMIEVMQKYHVKKCFYGHLHGNSIKNAVVGEHFNINFSLVSADSLDFCMHNILK